MKDIFCANCQQITSHKGYVDSNGEFVFECQNVLTAPSVNDQGQILTPAILCLRAIKFPSDTTPEQFNKLVVDHQEQNEGQISIVDQEKKLADLLGESSS